MCTLYYRHKQIFLLLLDIFSLCEIIFNYIHSVLLFFTKQQYNC